MSGEDIIKAAGLKNGKPIFMLDKQKAINNIQSRYPMVKVVQIKTKSVISVEIIVRPRQETYYILTEDEKYTVTAQRYCIMDEELMAMDGELCTDQKPERLNGLVELIIDDSLKDQQQSSTDTGEYFAQPAIRSITSNLYNSFCSTVVVEDGKVVADKTKTPNATRQDFISIVKSVTLKSPKTDHQELNTLVKDEINLSLAVNLNGKDITINIKVAQKDLQYKVNLCFNTIANYFESNPEGTITTFNCGYDDQHNIKITY